MATEGTRTSGIFSLKNYVMGAGVLVGSSSEKIGFFDDNLLSPLRSKKWIPAVNSSATVTFDLTTAIHVDVFALVDCPYGSSDSVKLEAASGISGSLATGTLSTVATWNPITTWASSRNGCSIFVLSTPDSGTYDPGTTRRYWRVTFTGTSAVEVGVVWLGNKYDLPVDTSIKVKQLDRSTDSMTYNGARYVDPLRTYHSGSILIPATTESTAFSLKEDLVLLGGSLPCLIDVMANRSTTTERRHGAFYAYLDKSGGLSLGYKALLAPDIKLSFIEASG